MATRALALPEILNPKRLSHEDSTATLPPRHPGAGMPIEAKPQSAPAEPSSADRSSEQSGSAPQNSKRHRNLLILGAVLATAAICVAALHFYRYAATHEETDDAYTVSHVHAVSSRINDTVLKVLVDDNEHVKAGQVLVQLDPADFQVRLDQAQAALNVAQRQAQVAATSIGVADDNASGKATEAAGNVDAARANVAKAQASVTESRAAIPEAQAQLAQRQAEEHRASLDFTRYKYLAAQGAVSVQQRDQALRDYQVAKEASAAAQDVVLQAQARLSQAQQAVAQAAAQLEQSRGLIQEAQALKIQTVQTADQYRVAQASVAQAAAQLRDAQLQLSYANIVAPVDGRVGNKTVEEGQRVQSGQLLMSVVADEPWVVANFKETQLERMRPGEPVQITIDSFPNHKFTGHVDSVAPGSGATFALLPPENATGNFTKIVQRVPVKVVFDPASIRGFEQLIVPGMSVIVNVTVGN